MVSKETILVVNKSKNRTKNSIFRDYFVIGGRNSEYFGVLKSVVLYLLSQCRDLNSGPLPYQVKDSRNKFV